MGQVNTLKIGLIQMECKFLDVPFNSKRAERYIRFAAQKGARLVCLPEAFNTGYYGNEIDKMLAFTEDLNGKTLHMIARLAKELSIYILAPLFTKTLEGVYNSAHFISDKGDIIGSYSKTHPIGREKELLCRGNEYFVWNTDIGRIGCLICYDICFPETVRMLALKGVQLILVPSAWRASRYYTRWWNLNLSCRALDNLIYIAGVNQIGMCGNEYFAGDSQVCNMIGETIAKYDAGEEGVLLAEINFAGIEAERKINTVLEDRHPEDYCEPARGN